MRCNKISIIFFAIQVFAQNNGDPEELPSPTFLESQLEGRTQSIDPGWEWQPILSRAYTYNIHITSPNSWEAAYLCVDGAPIKQIKLSKREFKWTFEALDVGTHQIGLLVLGADNQAGYIEKELRL